MTAYSLAFGSLLLLGGRIGVLFGRKRTLIIGLAGFAGASAIGGASVDFPMLVTARTVQGAFGALLAPSVLALLTTTFTDFRERGEAFAIYGGIAEQARPWGCCSAGSSRPTRHGAGLSTSTSSPACRHGRRHAIGWRTTTPTDGDSARHPQTLLVTQRLVLPGLRLAPRPPLNNPFAIGFLVFGVCLRPAGLARGAGTPSPLVLPQVVRNRTHGRFRSWPCCLAAWGCSGSSCPSPPTCRGPQAGPSRDRFAFLPMIAALATMARVSNRSCCRFGPRVVVPAGLLHEHRCVASCTQSGSTARTSATYSPRFCCSAWVSPEPGPLGTAPAPRTQAQRSRGYGSATLNAYQQVGGSIGTALLDTLTAAPLRVPGRPDGDAGEPAGAHFTPAPRFVYSALIFVVPAVVAGLVLQGDMRALSARPRVTSRRDSSHGHLPEQGSRDRVRRIVRLMPGRRGTSAGGEQGPSCPTRSPPTHPSLLSCGCPSSDASSAGERQACSGRRPASLLNAGRPAP